MSDTVSRLRGGIIGCGFFAQFHLEAWRRMPDIELVAACDLDLDRARKAAPRAYSSPEEMLANEKLDFVDIATRPATHLPLVCLAVQHKIPVICQKPMAPSWSDAVQMVEAAESRGVPLMIHENWRWQPWFRTVNRMIQDGEIGEPLSYWFRTRKADGLGEAPYPSQPYFRQMPRLLIYETLVHHIDTARFLFGDIASIFARARRRNPIIAGEDQALLLLTHARGLAGWIDGHRFRDPDPEGVAMGEAYFEGDRESLHVLATGEIYRGRARIWEPPVTDGYKGDSVFGTQRHFIECLRGGKPFESGGREYLKTFGAVEAAYRSLSENLPVSPASFPS
ncbi:MAG: Gfo/Idh/MocA family oxidoreductase [Bryobacteraceae bacterium]